ncbi:MAG TPA: hypothetical protein VF230_14010 [Acidimicrobiales bacterium]
MGLAGGEDVTIDPVVFALLVALASRTPIATVGADGVTRAAAGGGGATAALPRPREALARLPRSKNRKG